MNNHWMIAQIVEWSQAAFAHRGVRRYGSNIIWLGAEKALRLVVGLLVGAYVGRILGPERYGILNYAINFVPLFAVMMTMGMETILVRELVRAPEKAANLLGSSFLLRCGGFAAMTLVIGVVLAAAPLASEVKVLIWIVLAGYLFQTFQVVDYYFQARVESKFIALPQMAALLAVSGLRIYLALSRAPLWCFAAAESLYMALAVLGGLLCYRLNGGRVTAWRWRPALGRNLFRETFPLLLAGVAAMLYIRIDQLMITPLLGAAANGQYVVAARFMEVLIAVPIIFSDSFLPSMVGTRRTSLRRYYRRTEQLIRSMFYLALLLLIPAALGGRWLVELLYGAEYREGARLCLWYSTKFLLIFPGYIYTRWYMVEGMQKMALYVNAAGALTVIVLDYILLQVMGLPGAVVANVATTFLMYLIYPLPFRKGRQGVRLFLRGLAPPFM